MTYVYYSFCLYYILMDIQAYNTYIVNQSIKCIQTIQHGMNGYISYILVMFTY
jgi:hypothetical protein